MRRVFFSFHYQNDYWRVQQVMQSQVVLKMRGYTPCFSNPQEWENIKRQSPNIIKRWIKRQMHGTSVTVVLIGAETANRPYVQHEIKESLEDKKGLLGIYIHKVKVPYQKFRTPRGANPLASIKIPNPSLGSMSLGLSPGFIRASKYYDTYDWVDDNGRFNIGNWIKDAATKAGR